jgi:hypothetical protein
VEDVTSWKGDMCSRKLDNKGTIKAQLKDNKELDKVHFYSNRYKEYHIWIKLQLWTLGTWLKLNKATNCFTLTIKVKWHHW